MSVLEKLDVDLCSCWHFSLLWKVTLCCTIYFLPVNQLLFHRKIMSFFLWELEFIILQKRTMSKPFLIFRFLLWIYIRTKFQLPQRILVGLWGMTCKNYPSYSKRKSYISVVKVWFSYFIMVNVQFYYFVTVVINLQGREARLFGLCLQWYFSTPFFKD